MSKTSKVVSISEAKRKNRCSVTEIPVQAEGRIRILTCRQTPQTIGFDLGPPLLCGETPEPVRSTRGELLKFPVSNTDSKTENRE